MPTLSTMRGLPTAITAGGTGATSIAGAQSNLQVPPTSRTISAGSGLSGGGDLSANRSFALADIAQAQGFGRASGAGTGAPGALTPAQLITILLAADGAGSLFDADLLDGLQASAFGQLSANNNWTGTLNRFYAAATGESNALVQVRVGNNCFGWGHPSGGYGCNLGAEAGSGAGYVALNCEGGTNSNTYRTRGLVGFVMRSDNGGGITFNKASNSNADNQSLTTTLSVDSSGNVVAQGTVTGSSDGRLKRDVKAIDGALDKILSLRGVNFRWEGRHADDARDGEAGIGVIAQDVQRVFPEAVREDPNGYLSVAYGNLVAPLIEAVRTLAHRLDSIEADNPRGRVVAVEASQQQRAAA